jgi:hypothetical protein
MLQKYTLIHSPLHRCHLCDLHTKVYYAHYGEATDWEGSGGIA